MNHFLTKFSFVIIIIFFAWYPFAIFAQENRQICSPNGYTVVTINGVFTDETGAKENKDKLKNRLSPTFNNQPLTVDYLHNPSHIAGLGDLVMTTYQKIFDSETVEDYDLVEMIKDASEKIKTQKILLVAHSQGNFYANSFYDTVAGKTGGVPAESIGVYSVATPASRVAGRGKWLTSDTDKIIAGLVGSFPFKKIMPPNESIVLAENDDLMGHNFSGVYLKHRGSQIVSDIQSSLDKLQTNSIQNESSPCLVAPKITLAHKATGAVFSVVDPAANIGKDAVVVVAIGAHKIGKLLAEGVYSLTSFVVSAASSILSTDNKNIDNISAAIGAINTENSSNAAISEVSPSQELSSTIEVFSSSNSSQDKPAFSADNIELADNSIADMQKQLLVLQNKANSSSSPPPSRTVLDMTEPKLVTMVYPGFGGGGGMAPVSSSSSSVGLPEEEASSSSSSSDLPAEEAGSSSSSSSQSSSSSSISSSSSSVSDIIPPDLSLAISECQQSLSFDGCLVATTTLNIVWNSLSVDLDYFVINQNGAISTTTATSTNVIVSDNATFSFAVSAKDLAGNFSATSTRTAEVSLMPVVINEVAWAGNSSAYSVDEWVELYNRTNLPVDLSNFIFYSKTDLSPYINLSGTVAPSGYYLIERTDDNTVSDIAADLTSSFGNGLANTGENIALVYKPIGQATTTIDEIPYDFNWYNGSASNYAAMERYDTSAAGTNSSNWGTNNTIIKNGKNAGGGNINGTPKARNSVDYLINKGQNVSSNLTLYASSSPYLVNNSVQTFSASSTLTIEPGVVIKFYNDAGLSFSNGAKILAQGTTANPIIFTSFYDDNYAGDTNGDATSTSPTSGNWYGVRINSPGAESAVNNSIFRYGGRYYNGPWSDSRANFYIANSFANINDSIFEHSKVYGLKMVNSDSSITGSIFRNNNNTLDTAGYDSSLLATGGSPLLSGNSFVSNHKGVYFFNSPAAVDSNIFTDNANEAVYSYGQLGFYSNNSGTGNFVNGIVMHGNLTTADSTTTLGINFLPYVIKTYDANVVASSTLVIPSGVVLKADKKLNVNGSLNITGSSSGDVVLTSLYDDTVGGDTTNNGSTTPQAGDGGWISVSNKGSFTGSGFTARYGGRHAHGGNNSAWLYFDGSVGSVSNALFDNNYPYGVYALNSPSLTISDTSFANHALSGNWGTKAALATLVSTTTLSTVSFLNNVLGVLSGSLSTFIINAVTFTNNIATTSPGGLW